MISTNTLWGRGVSAELKTKFSREQIYVFGACFSTTDLFEDGGLIVDVLALFQEAQLFAQNL